jgi:hypothetical protein
MGSMKNADTRRENIMTMRDPTVPRGRLTLVKAGARSGDYRTFTVRRAPRGSHFAAGDVVIVREHGSERRIVLRWTTG